MRCIVYFFILWTLSFSKLLGQAEINSELYLAEQMYRSNENLDQAVKYYQIAFDKKNCDASKVFYAIACATKINDTAAIIKFFEKGIKLGLVPGDFAKNWTYYGNNLVFENLISQADTTNTRASYLADLDSVLISKMSILASRDQMYRNDDELFEIYQRKNDSLNWKELKQIVDSLERLPLYSELGFDGTDNLEGLFYHMDMNELEWFLPFIIENLKISESNLAETLLYQIERIGMAEGKIFTVTAEYKIIEYGTRTQMKTGHWCQSFGQWFFEKGKDGLHYETPIDPGISINEINRVRNIFYLDDLESKRLRTPWIKSVDINYFEEIVAY